MRNLKSLLCAVLPLVSAAVVGCGTDPADEKLGSSEARIVLASQGDGAATMHVTAIDIETSEVVLDKSVDVNPNSATMINVALDAKTYKIHVQATAKGDNSKVIGSGDTQANLKTGLTTEITLTAKTDGGASGAGSVTVGVNTAPQIKDIHVDLAATAATGADGNATLKVDAVDPDGDGLTYFWSGLGLEGAVQGSSTITISAAAAASFPGSKTVHLVVQDSAGATTAANIDFSGSGSCLLCGDSETTVGSKASAGADAEACLDARVECNASCSVLLSLDPAEVTANVACISACGLDLATCDAG